MPVSYNLFRFWAEIKLKKIVFWITKNLFQSKNIFSISKNKFYHKNLCLIEPNIHFCREICFIRNFKVSSITTLSNKNLLGIIKYNFILLLPFGGKMNENASNLTHEFLYDNFNKKILLNFLVKIVIQKLMCQIWCIFKDKWFISSSKTRRWEAKVLISCRRIAHVAVNEIFILIINYLCHDC